MRRLGSGFGDRQVFVRLFVKLIFTSGTTEVKGFSFVLRHVLGSVMFYRHAANRVDAIFTSDLAR